MSKRVRNADKARNSFVTRKVENKLAALAKMFQNAAGERWEKTEIGTLQRTLKYSGFHYLDTLKLVYNWENRFMAVNYNLQMVNIIDTDRDGYEEPGTCAIDLDCNQKGLRGKRTYGWRLNAVQEGKEKGTEETKWAQYQERLSHPLIMQRLQDLDIMEMQIRHKESWDYWRVSCESLIGSATWMLIPPVTSMITPTAEECVKFLELFELIGDALVNNKKESENEKDAIE